MENSLKQIADRLRRAKSVAIFSHTNPDGDAIGSALALSCALESLGLNTQVCIESDLPSNLQFVEGLDKITKAPIAAYDLLVCVDWLGWNGNVWKLFTAVLVIILNYIGSKFLVFKNKK